MSVVEIKTKQDADSIFRSGYRIVIIDHYGDWCFPCKMVAPQFEELAKKFSSENILFAKCNADLRLFEVSGLPTFEFYVDGQKVEQVVGADILRVQNLVQSLAHKPMSAQEMTQMSFADNGKFQPQQSVPVQNSARNNPYSIGSFKTSSRGKGGQYSSYSNL